MRTAVVVLALFAAGGLSLASADPPVTPSAPQSAAAPAPAPTPAPAPAASAAPPVSTAAAAPQTPVSAPAEPVPKASAPGAPDEEMIEKQLRLQGYRLSMVRGEQKYCRREAPIGSRFESAMHCVTLAEAEHMWQEGRETTEHIQQRNMPGCLTAAMGGCGH